MDSSTTMDCPPSTEGGVKLNGEVETRKRKKVFVGDVVKYLDRAIQVVMKAPSDADLP